MVAPELFFICHDEIQAIDQNDSLKTVEYDAKNFDLARKEIPRAIIALMRWFSEASGAESRVSWKQWPVDCNLGLNNPKPMYSYENVAYPA